MSADMPFSSPSPDRGSSPRSWPLDQRLVAFSFIGCLIAFTDRVDISIAAVSMKAQFGWSEAQVGWVLSAFFLGYMPFLFVSGLLARRFGGRRVAGIAMIVWSSFTLLTPLAATVSLPTLIAVRIGMGMGEAGLFPAVYELFGGCIPAREQARAVSRFVSGVPLGTIVGLSASGWLIARYGWPMPFYFFGVAGLVWALLWFRCLRHIGPAASSPPDDSTNTLRLLRRLLLRGAVWAIVAAQFATNWTQHMLLSWLPSYFRDVQGISTAKTGLLSAAPWLAMAVATILCGSLSDRLSHRGISVSRVRKLILGVGLIGSALLLFVAGGARTPASASLLVTGATAAVGCAVCGFVPAILDIAPRHSGILVGFTNTLAQIPAFTGVFVTGWLVDRTGSYAAAFMLAGAISVAGTLIFTCFFSLRAVGEGSSLPIVPPPENLGRRE
jgi:ACS family sodium-dependent inorganic phosphate cotransporter